jgi:predicted DCC family thiol-disulfide oxidoreductase YuxK
MREEAQNHARINMLCFARMAQPEQQAEMVFYDGNCGLCHWAVKFILKHDRSEDHFHFAPLQGTTFASRVAPERRSQLPDSVVLLTHDGSLLTRSDAFLHILRRLGGKWKMLASLASLIPRRLRDCAYDFIAWIRYRVFGKRDELCPIVPAELRARFEP